MIKGKNTNYCNTCPTGLRGLCCWHSLYDGTEHFIIYPCEYLSLKTNRCKIYKKRFKINPECYTVLKALTTGALPKECPYVIESDIVPKIPNKIFNIKKLEMIKNGIKI